MYLCLLREAYPVSFPFNGHSNSNFEFKFECLLTGNETVAFRVDYCKHYRTAQYPVVSYLTTSTSPIWHQWVIATVYVDVDNRVGPFCEFSYCITKSNSIPRSLWIKKNVLTSSRNTTNNYLGRVVWSWNLTVLLWKQVFYGKVFNFDRGSLSPGKVLHCSNFQIGHGKVLTSVKSRLIKWCHVF